MHFLFSVLFLLTVFFLSANAFYTSRDEVREIHSLDEVVNSEGVWLVEFYAPWCGHCKNLASTWKKVASDLKGVVNIAAIDATAHEQEAQKYQITGFPTIKVFGSNKNSPSTYQGERSETAIEQAALSEIKKLVQDRRRGNDSSSSSSGGKKKKKKTSSKKSSKSSSSSDVISLTGSNFYDEVRGSEDLWFVEFYAPWCGHCKNLAPEWEEAATQLKGMAKVAAVDATVEQALAQEFGVTGYPTIKVFRPGSSAPMDYPGERTADKIIDFALGLLETDGKGPSVSQLVSQDLFEESCEGKRICVVAFLPSLYDTGKDGRNNYIDTLQTVATEMRTAPFNFFWMEGGSQPAFEEAFSLPSAYPTLIALSMEKLAYSTYLKAFDNKSIKKFLSALSHGRQGSVPLSEEEQLPALLTVEPWNGEEAPPLQEEEFSLDELFGDDEL